MNTWYQANWLQPAGYLVCLIGAIANIGLGLGFASTLVSNFGRVLGSFVFLTLSAFGIGLIIAVVVATVSKGKTKTFYSVGFLIASVLISSLVVAGTIYRTSEANPYASNTDDYADTPVLNLPPLPEQPKDQEPALKTESVTFEQKAECAKYRDLAQDHADRETAEGAFYNVDRVFYSPVNDSCLYAIIGVLSAPEVDTAYYHKSIYDALTAELVHSAFYDALGEDALDEDF